MLLERLFPVLDAAKIGGIDHSFMVTFSLPNRFWGAPTSRKSSHFAFAWLGILGLGLISWHFHYSFLLYSETNGGVLINAAWQQYTGSVPYRDFLTASPPLFLLPAGEAFHCMGPTWGSLSVLVCLFSSTTFIWLFLLIWRATDAIWTALAISFAEQVLTFIPISWWWYNEATEVVAALFFSSVCALARKPRDRFAMGSFIAAEALLGLGKVNIAAPLILLCIAFLLTIRALRLFAVVATVVAAALDTGFLAAQGISIGSLLHNYSQAAGGRLSPAALYCVLIHPGYGEAIIMATSLTLFVTGILVAITFARFTCQITKGSLLLLFGIALFIALCGVVTNTDNKTVDITCLVAILPFIELPKVQGTLSLAKISYGISVCMIGVLMAFMTLTSMGRFQMIWFGTFAPPVLRVTLQTPALFRGMKVSPDFAKLLDDLSSTIKDKSLLNNRSRKIFFGPKLDFGYAIFGIREQPGFPLWWEGVPSIYVQDEYPTGSPDATQPFQYPLLLAGHLPDPRVQHFFDTKFDTCLFRVGDAGVPDMSFFPADLRKYIYDHYNLEYHASVAIFSAKP